MSTDVPRKDVPGPAPAASIAVSDADEAWISAPRRDRQLARLTQLGRALRAPSVGIPAAVFVVVVLACFAGPALLSLPSPVTGDLANAMAPMGSPGHPLGTNELGNDVLSRLLHGGRVSIVVGLGATAISLLAGALLGVTAGFFGGFYETFVMRLFDTLLAFPGLILALVIADYLGPSLTNTTLAISLFGVSRFGRLAWSQTLTVRHRDFVTAPRSDGAAAYRVIFGHILPNVLPPLLGFALFTIGTAMMIEAGLSYLGLGVPEPEPTWGNLIASGDAYLSSDPRLVVLPSMALFITVLSLNLVADGLRGRLTEER
ncbi:ABC transporter permease [Plantactinospora solaniradicis]|uniref:ABC transporter permease n=1 Tax=Plantactinospora solaniradicis TaxID=1723736 RepID=A0ABW1KL61_9ACTN